MRTVAALVLLAALAACSPPTGPVARPGLWRQSISLSGSEYDPASPPAPIVSEICVGRGGRIKIPYYRAHRTKTCMEDAIARTSTRGWSSRTVCEHAELGTIVTTAEVEGDMQDFYVILGQVTLGDGSKTRAQVTGQYVSDRCPEGMRPGDERPAEAPAGSNLVWEPPAE